MEAEATVARGDGRTVLHYLTGPAAGMRIIQQENQVWEVGPKGVRRAHKLGIECPLPDPKALQENFVVRKVGHAQVANRPTSVVSISPRSGPNAQIVVWLDDETHFPLARQQLADGRVVSETRYISVRYNVPPPKKWEPPQQAGERGRWRARGLDIQRVDAAGAAKILGTAVKRPTYLPGGFAEQGLVTLRYSRAGAAVQIRYGDGLRVMTITEHRRPRLVEQQGARQGRWAQARIVQSRQRKVARRLVGEIVVTVSGPLSDRELLKVARSVR